jgi:signal transduction histidine kinase
MEKRVQFGAKSIPLAQMDVLASRHFYGGESPIMGLPSSAGLAITGADFFRREGERRAFALAANAIREEEKARVARELHDELAQSLCALKMDTLWVRDHAAHAPEAVVARLTDMLAMIDRTVTATRRIAADLRPMMLDDLGLVPAIEWLVEGFTQRSGVACKLSLDEGLQLELQEPYATAVFRIVQESLANVFKHAGASQVQVALGKVPHGVMLLVQDDGCGFLPAALRKPGSLGLMGLRERVQLLGGSVSLQSTPGQGTCVEVYIPWVHSEEGAVA